MAHMVYLTATIVSHNVLLTGAYMFLILLGVYSIRTVYFLQERLHR